MAKTKSATINRPLIAMIEDNEPYARVTGLKFAKEGYELVVMNTADKFYDFLKTKMPDLVLLDLVLPGTDGFDVLKKIKATPEWKSLKVIIISSLNQPEDKEKCKKLGAVDFLSKTEVSLYDMTKMIREYLK